MIGKRNTGIEEVVAWQGVFDEYRGIERPSLYELAKDMMEASGGMAIFYDCSGQMLWATRHGRQMLPEFTPSKAPTSVLAMDYCLPALPDSFAELPEYEPGFLDIYERIGWGWSQLQARKTQAMRNESIRQQYMHFDIMRQRLGEMFSDDHGIE